MRSSNALQSRALGITWVYSEMAGCGQDDGGLLGPFGHDLEEKLGAERNRSLRNTSADVVKAAESFYNVLSRVMGRSRTRLPMALYTAFATAAPTP
jgi:hypothetical protein